MNKNLLTISEAANYLSVSIDTLRLWDKNRKLMPIKTIGGHRRYEIEELDKLLKSNDNGKRMMLRELLYQAQQLAIKLNDSHANEITKILMAMSG